MTSLSVWTGVDQRGPASLYIATDSRISWPDGRKPWDHGRKTFHSHTTPDIFGYVGDVLFPAMTLPLVVDLFDHQGLTGADMAARQARFESLVRAAAAQLPGHVRADVVFVHCSRDGSGVGCEFGLQLLRYRKATDDWSVEKPPMAATSSELELLGSGRNALEDALAEWRQSDASGTSRAAFSAFCEALERGADRATGGPPQLVGLYRQGPGRPFGVSWQDELFLHGTPIRSDTSMPGIEWRDRLFQRVDASRRLVDGAQVHADRKAGA
ncbi:hypothetical protein AB0K51_32550 [Kitasatospora sp. NPDC049285]|uniref:hypothetical protein n=1 Tax=Kitasatospora sp. NPDC049285 TaxID=3157096 RepID=UPI00342759C3